MNNAERDRKLYRYPDSDLLRNVPDIRDSVQLQLFEQESVQQRMREGPPSGNFDLAHLQAIHCHLFQDVYEWAGEVRRVDISKGGRWFHPHDRIETGMADVHRRLVSGKFLTGLGRKDFAQEAGAIIGDVNLVHPFREGNGRTQFQYLKQLGRLAGHYIDLTRFERDEWIGASIASIDADYGPMSACILNSITGRGRLHREDMAAQAFKNVDDRIAADRADTDRDR